MRGGRKQTNRLYSAASNGKPLRFDVHCAANLDFALSLAPIL